MSDKKDDQPKAADLPDVATLRNSVTLIRGDTRQVASEEAREKAIFNERRYVHLIGLRDHYKHKGRWSVFVSILMFILVVFQCILLWKVGEGAWSFEKYTWLLPALLVQNFGQIVGLAIVVVKALFKDIKD